MTIDEVEEWIWLKAAEDAADAQPDLRFPLARFRAKRFTRCLHQLEIPLVQWTPAALNALWDATPLTMSLPDRSRGCRGYQHHHDILQRVISGPSPLLQKRVDRILSGL